MDESYLKAKLVKASKRKMPEAVIFRLEDQYTAAIPDMALTWAHRTIWIEAKYAQPTVTGRLNQLINCQRLEDEGLCIYVIYQFKNKERKTMVVSPSKIRRVRGKTLEVLETISEAQGFHHDFVASEIARIIDTDFV